MTVATAGSHTEGRSDLDATHAPGRQLAWFAAVAIIAFLVPYVGTSALDLNHDVYYLFYFAVALAAVAAYVVANDVDVTSLVAQNWKLSLAIGAVASAFVVWNVLAREDGTPHPDGAYFVFEILWRGVAYGAVDAILLTAFPAMVAFTLMRATLQRSGGAWRSASSRWP